MGNSSFIRNLCVLLVMVTTAIANSNENTDDFSSQSDLTDQRISVDAIILNNFEAVRDESSFNKFESMDVILRITEAGVTLLARYRASTDGHMRIDVFEGDARVYSEGKDESGVWEWPGGKEAPENVYHDGIAALEHGIEFNLFTLAELSGRGHLIELVDKEKLRGETYFILKVTMSDGFETLRYVNADTWLIDLSRDFRAFHPGVDDRKKSIETRYDQWKRVDGILFASRSENVNLNTGKVIATTIVLKSRYKQPRDELDLARGYVPKGPPSP